MLNFFEKNKISLVYLPLALYWAVLITLTSLPGRDLPNIKVSDKIEHIIAFCGLAILLKMTLMVQNKFENFKKNSSLFTLIIIGIYAGLDELHQLFIPGRSCDILDWLADMTGAFIAAFLIGFILKKFSLNS